MDDDDELSDGLMLEPPIVGAKIETIDDADLAGWMYLAVNCRCGSVHLPWKLLRRETRYRRLDEIAARLRCRRRGCRPNRVSLYWRGGRDAQDIRELPIFPPPSNE